MTAKPFRFAALGCEDRKGFRCGNEALDRYFHQQVSQDVKRRITTCFVAVEQVTERIAGYYTLSAAEVPIAELPSEFAGRLPRYPTVPVARIGRLAVDQRLRGKKQGSALLFNAVTRVAASDLAAYGIVVDAKDDDAVAFYQHHGLVAYSSAPNTLIAPIKALLGGEG